MKEKEMEEIVDELDDQFKAWDKGEKLKDQKLGNDKPIEEIREKETRSCFFCGMPFQTTDYRQRFCSKECEMKLFERGFGKSKSKQSKHIIKNKSLESNKKTERPHVKRFLKAVSKHSNSYGRLNKEQKKAIVIGILAIGLLIPVMYFYLPNLIGASIIAPREPFQSNGINIIDSSNGTDVQSLVNEISLYSSDAYTPDYENLNFLEIFDRDIENFTDISEAVVSYINLNQFDYPALVIEVDFNGVGYVSKWVEVAFFDVTTVSCSKII